VTITIGDIEGGGFYVADDGPGIPETDRPEVFESGYSSSEDGTGYGLAIVEEIVEGHGWSVTVMESADGGARFEIRL
jgi:signal transduction histidine kinase